MRVPDSSATSLQRVIPARPHSVVTPRDLRNTIHPVRPREDVLPPKRTTGMLSEFRQLLELYAQVLIQGRGDAE